jgi:hypothetical protein
LGLAYIITLDKVHNLGTVRDRENKLVEAAALFQRAVDVFGDTLRPKRKLTIKTMGFLGVVYAEFESDS